MNKKDGNNFCIYQKSSISNKGHYWLRIEMEILGVQKKNTYIFKVTAHAQFI